MFITGPDDPCQPHKTTQITMKHIYLHNIIYNALYKNTDIFLKLHNPILWFLSQ